MITHGKSGTNPAFDSRDLAGILAANRKLMERFKQAVEAGSVQAIHWKNRNFTVVADPGTAEAIRAAAPDLHVFTHDAATGEVRR